MKKYFLLLTLMTAVLFAGCSKDDNEQIVVPDKTELTQEAYADEETTGTVTFTTPASWTATVRETTRALGLEWLGLDKYSGDAGKTTIIITLKPNYSGETRTAEIDITSDGITVTVKVTQSGVKEDGNVPVNPDAPYYIGSVYPHVGEAQGIVFWLDPKGEDYDDGSSSADGFASGKNGKIMSLDQASLAWALTPVISERTYTYDEDNGLNNVSKIKALPDWQKNYPAFAWCDAKGEGWYLPARNEMRSVNHAFNGIKNEGDTPSTSAQISFNAIITEAGGTAFDPDAPDTSIWYWTSNEMDDSYGDWATVQHMGNVKGGGNRGFYKDEEHYFRAIKAF